MSEGVTRSKDGVPQWSGDASLFQAYEEEALQWEQGIVYQKRYLCGPRLISELSGTAKKFVVGKRPDWVSFNGGVQRLMTHLRESLGRPQIPELSDLLTKFFRQSRRRRFETMNDYIVRKVELYARARQAMGRVMPHYGSQGPWQGAGSWHGRNGWSGWTDRSWSGWNGDRQQSWRQWQPAGTNPTPSARGDGEEVEAYQECEEGEEEDQWWQPSVGGSAYHGSWEGREEEEWTSTSPELLPEFLQGWYLLNDSGLDSHERNLVQTEVQGDFTLAKVAQALRAQWPDEELKKRDQASRPAAFYQEAPEDEAIEATGDQKWTADSLQKEGMSEEGIYLIGEEEQKAEEALALLHQAKRTLREARARQHQVKMSRQYYKIEGKSHSSARKTEIKCFKCGGPHKIAECPDRHGPKAAEAKHAEDEQAPFVCYSEETEKEQLCYMGDVKDPKLMTTSEAIQAGYGIVDGGATRTLGSVHALEAVMEQNLKNHQESRVLKVDPNNTPSFGFGNSSRDTCCSTATMGITANSRPGELTIHALDKGEGPILLSISMLRRLGAVIDFENDMIVFRHINAKKIIKAERSVAGHQLLPLSKDLYTNSVDSAQPVPSLKDFCSC